MCGALCDLRAASFLDRGAETGLRGGGGMGTCLRAKISPHLLSFAAKPRRNSNPPRLPSNSSERNNDLLGPNGRGTRPGPWGSARRVLFRRFPPGTLFGAGELLNTLKGHTAGVTCCCFSGDGDRVVSCGWDRTVRTWKAFVGMPLPRGASAAAAAATVAAIAVAREGLPPNDVQWCGRPVLQCVLQGCPQEATFLVRTALKDSARDHQSPTANRRQPPTANNRQLLTDANRQPPTLK